MAAIRELLGGEIRRDIIDALKPDSLASWVSQQVGIVASEFMASNAALSREDGHSRVDVALVVDEKEHFINDWYVATSTAGLSRYRLTSIASYRVLQRMLAIHSSLLLSLRLGLSKHPGSSTRNLVSRHSKEFGRRQFLD